MSRFDRDEYSDRGERHQRSYWEVRWSWFKKYDLEELGMRFRLDFDVSKPERTKPAMTMSVLWEELLVKADNLSILVSSMRACLFQKQIQSLTVRDTRLQNLVYELYPYTRHVFYSPIDLLLSLLIAIKNWFKRGEGL